MNEPFAPDHAELVKKHLTPSPWWETAVGSYFDAALESVGVPMHDVIVVHRGNDLDIYTLANARYGMQVIRLSADRLDNHAKSWISYAAHIMVIKLRRRLMLEAVDWSERSPLPTWAGGISTVTRRMIEYVGLDAVTAWKTPRDHERAWERSATGAGYSETWFPFGAAAEHFFDIDLTEPFSSVRPSCDFDGCWMKLAGTIAPGVRLDQSTVTSIEIDRPRVPATIVAGMIGRRFDTIAGISHPSLLECLADRTVLNAVHTKVWYANEPIVSLVLDDPFESIEPAPAEALAAIFRQHHPLAGTCFPWWLHPEQ